MLWNILVAFSAAVFSSMGVGGGAILLLYLTAFSGMEQLKAQGINLLFFLPCAAIALLFHHKNGYIRTGILKRLFLSLIHI